MISHAVDPRPRYKWPKVKTACRPSFKIVVGHDRVLNVKTDKTINELHDASFFTLDKMSAT